MDAILEKVTRTDLQGEETEIASDVPCEVDTDARELTVTADRDLGLRIGDELESDAFEWKRTVRGVRKERTEDGFRITLSYE
jgi:hypothetical protein